MDQTDLELIARKLPVSDATRKRNQAGGVPPCPEPKRVIGHEPVATEEGKRPEPIRRLVRIKSYRLRLVDERNLADKYFTDALQYAGAIYSDAPKYAQIIVTQEQVYSAASERTEVEIIPL